MKLLPPLALPTHERPHELGWPRSRLRDRALSFKGGGRGRRTGDGPPGPAVVDQAL